MILFMIAAFGLLLASVYLGTWLQHDPGYVLIMIHHWTIESTFWVAATATIILVILLQVALSTIKNIVGIPHHWRQWRDTRRLSRAQTKTKKGMIEFSEGHWHTAKKHLIAAAPNVEQPLVNYLTAAKAAEKLGDHRLRDQYLHQAQAAAPDATIAIELTQAQLQVDNQEWEEALATLNALQIIAPDHPYVIQLYIQVYQAMHNWADLLVILPKLKTSPSLSEKDIHQIKRLAYLNLIQIWLSQPVLEKKNISMLQTLPHDLKHDPEIITWYGRYLLHHLQYQIAEKSIRECLKINKNPELIALYGQLNAEYVRIPFIESLLRQDPNSAELHLCLGQLFLTKKVWGTAKNHLEKSLQIQPSIQAYHALGTLLETLDQQTEACHAYRQGLELFSQQQD